MSLIIHTIVKDGIVVCSDSRTTIKNNKDNSIRFDDTAEKIIPFPNRIVVSHCDSSKINDKITVTDFLYSIRHKIGDTANIVELPLQILNEYHAFNGTNSVIFLISGVCLGKMYTYRITTSTNEVKLCKDSFGSSYNGTTDVCHSIMNSNIDYSNLSLIEAINLTKLCMNTNIELYKYINGSCIGGQCRTYVIDSLHNQCGWLNKNNTLTKDKDISDTAKQDKYYEMMNKMLKSR